MPKERLLGIGEIAHHHQAARLGYDIVSGMHTRLASVPLLEELARENGGHLIDVRVPPPDIPVLCHDLSRTEIEDVEGYPIPPLPTCIERYLDAARLTNRNVRCVGVSVNASGVDDATYRHAKARIEEQTGLPCTDPIRDGVEGLVEALERVVPAC